MNNLQESIFRVSDKDGLNLPFAGVVDTLDNMICCSHTTFHRHNFYMLAWAAQPVTLTCDFVNFELAKGTLAFITPGQIHCWENVMPDTNDLILFSFKPELLMNNGIDVHHTLSDLPFHDPTTQPFIASGSRENLFERLFLEVLAICDRKSGNIDFLLASYLRLILAEVKSLKIPEETYALSAGKHLVRQFYEAIQLHFTQRLQVQDYAAMLGVTSNHLVETIRQTTGFTPGQLLHQQLLLEAKRLLVYTHYTNAEIAEHLSFQTPSHFGQWFRKNEGITPGDFRRQL